MPDLTLTHAGPELTPDAVQQAQTRVGVAFPPAVVALYLRVNGGVPADPYWRADENDEVGILVGQFLPMGRGGEEGGRLESLHARMVSRGVLDPELVPFAVDCGSNFVCFDASGAIHFVTTDSWRSELTAAENRARSRRLIADSLEDFLENLHPESELP